jgi:2-polyprenyl-6-methoxyphenol hydroxylase-like FAD-dependent oxidoreductase
MSRDVLIVGGGIAGLTLALSLHQAGLSCRVFEAAPAFKPLGVGVNLLPHAMRELTELGLLEALSAVGVATREIVFCNRFGQTITTEPRGRFAGYDWPQLSIHRADLHAVLLAAVQARLGEGAVVVGKRFLQAAQNADRVTAHFDDGTAVHGAALIGADGIHSAVRRQLHPHEGPPSYQGINMWRGVTRAKPFLTGASMIIGGWLEVGKMVVYPIRNAIDAQGHQLINWVAEIQSPRNVQQDWNLAGKLEDFLPTFKGWRFDWLDVVALMQQAEQILEYPMVDRDPLPFWTQARITLMGDAAHPMYPRGSNGAGQAILDARVLAACLRESNDVTTALQSYQAKRLQAAYDVVLANRTSGPDSLLRTVHERTADQPFIRIEDVMSAAEIEAIGEKYKRIAGFEREQLRQRPSFL